MLARMRRMISGCDWRRRLRNTKQKRLAKTPPTRLRALAEEMREVEKLLEETDYYVGMEGVYDALDDTATELEKEGEMKLICPKCGSYDIDQYPIMHGPIWCESCGHKAKHKELYNPFVYYEPQPPQQQDLPARLRGLIQQGKEGLHRLDNSFYRVERFQRTHGYVCGNIPMDAIKDVVESFRQIAAELEKETNAR